MLDGIDLADIHGQHKLNFRHAAISRDDSKRFMDWASLRDYELNGPSLYRICETMLQGWRRYRDHSDARVRARFDFEAQPLKTWYAAALWVMERQLKDANAEISQRIHGLRLEIESEFGGVTRWMSRAVGPVLLWKHRREERRLKNGIVYQPPVFIERRNWGALRP